MINADIPTIFVNAESIGYAGTELQDAMRQHTPKVAFVAKPVDYTVSSDKKVAAADVDLLVRALSMGKLHHAP